VLTRRTRRRFQANAVARQERMTALAAYRRGLS